MSKEIVSIEVTIISLFGEAANLKVDKVNSDGSKTEIFMDPIKIGDTVVLEGISLKEE